jgi:hypothetical protein
MKGKNVLYGTALYIAVLFAVYGQRTINSAAVAAGGGRGRVPMGHEGMRTDAWPQFRQEIHNFQGGF